MLAYCDAGDLHRLRGTSVENAQLVQSYLQHRVRKVGARYFANGKVLQDLLHTCDAVVSGSTVLHILLPESGTAWTPVDLDIYVPQRTCMMMLRRLKVEGYSVVKEKVETTMGYPYLAVSRVIIVGNGQTTINVVVSRSATSISPIFQFHTTAVMNFFSADSIFCSYPNLTLRHLTMVNAGPLYFGTMNLATIDAMTKYKARGF
ncbi:hypothetical protein EDD15DRAFT_2134073, partial [Pisolithus albus]